LSIIPPYRAERSGCGSRQLPTMTTRWWMLSPRPSWTCGQALGFRRSAGQWQLNNFWSPGIALSSRLTVGTKDFHPATRPGMNNQSEAVQLCDRGHQIETKAYARRISDLVGPIETPQHRLALMLADAATGIDDAHDRFTISARQLNSHPTAFRCKLDGIVDEVGDRLKQEISVAANIKPLFHLEAQVHILVLGDRLVHIAYFPQHFVQ